MLARKDFYDPDSSYVFTFIQKTCFVDFILCGEKQRLMAPAHLRFLLDNLVNGGMSVSFLSTCIGSYEAAMGR